ncbi:PREDICTED: caspase-3-like [Acropora digitifera]|uniref:caspase-3-like n=1 Tax=Acropora digitifera TaxID=70779 RepID=UPI00077A6A89|nr:PREDICTED: caspase-3-like [Acropora digitifera]
MKRTWLLLFYLVFQIDPITNWHFDVLIAAQVHGQEASGYGIVRDQSNDNDQINYIAKTGYVLVINNVQFPGRRNPVRSGSDEDVQRLVDLFQDFRFEIRESRDLERRDMMILLRDTSARDFTNYDCFVCVILSHGEKDGICGTDDEVITLEAITSLFRRDPCPSLQGKPKIFLIQACRGTQRDQVSTESDSDPIFYSKPSLPADADFLICFASAPGHECYREGSIGSWFICAIHKVFKEYAHKEHIMDMMLRVNNEVAGYLSSGGLKQMPCEICMLTKKVFFQQGLNVP